MFINFSCIMHVFRKNKNKNKNKNVISNDAVVHPKKSKQTNKQTSKQTNENKKKSSPSGNLYDSLKNQSSFPDVIQSIFDSVKNLVWFVIFITFLGRG